MILTLTQKDLLELKYWFTADMAAEQAMIHRYLDAFAIPALPPSARILEIGTGPQWGLLPLIQARGGRFGVDPLYPAYYAAGILAEPDGITRVDECFERWDTNESFDVILTTNALDHGEMGFYLLPKMARLLKPGGRLFVHVHLRPPDLVNLIHDHALKIEDLDKHLSYTSLIEERREFYERDLDDKFCQTVVGVWRTPE